MGIETDTPYSTTYLFGFHLWYMRPDQARTLVERMLEEAPTSVNDPLASSPSQIMLSQNYPNPFNAGTIIEFELAVAGPADLDIFNILGQRVRSLCHTRLASGEHRIEWNGLTDDGRPAASGIYLCRLRAGAIMQTRKMLLLR